MPQAAFQAIVSGRVQLVMYRDFAERKARSLGITGEVGNLPDGTVRVVAEGEKGALLKFGEALRTGPVLALVEDIQIEWKEPTGAFDSFSINYHP